MPSWIRGGGGENVRATCTRVKSVVTRQDDVRDGEMHFGSCKNRVKHGRAIARCMCATRGERERVTGRERTELAYTPRRTTRSINARAMNYRWERGERARPARVPITRAHARETQLRIVRAHCLQPEVNTALAGSLYIRLSQPRCALASVSLFSFSFFSFFTVTNKTARPAVLILPVKSVASDEGATRKHTARPSS